MHNDGYAKGSMDPGTKKNIMSSSSYSSKQGALVAALDLVRGVRADQLLQRDSVPHRVAVPEVQEGWKISRRFHVHILGPMSEMAVPRCRSWSLVRAEEFLDAPLDDSGGVDEHVGRVPIRKESDFQRVVVVGVARHVAHPVIRQDDT